MITEKVYDYCFGEQFAVHYQKGKVQAVADIHNANLSNCHLDILAKFQVRANLYEKVGFELLPVARYFKKL